MINKNDFLDISILENIPDLSKQAVLEIEPLAPLSMVSDLPGSYYKTLKSPSKKMLCGLFENILGWHIDAAHRKEIVKDVQKIRKKQKLQFPETSGSTYMPLLMEYFEVASINTPELMHYDDYWSKAFRRQDAIVHAKGTFNLSYELISAKRELARNEKRSMQVDDKELEIFFKNNLDKYPIYYSSPTSREYVSITGKYQIKLIIDPSLYALIKEQLSTINVGSLGNSEGWVNLTMLEI